MKLERLHISVFLGLAVLVWWLVLLVRIPLKLNTDSADGERGFRRR